MDFNTYDFSKIDGTFTKDMVYPPFPGVEGYNFPFNYTNYFIEKFQDKEMSLKGKDFDTVKKKEGLKEAVYKCIALPF